MPKPISLEKKDAVVSNNSSVNICFGERSPTAGQWEGEAASPCGSYRQLLQHPKHHL